MGIFAFTTDIPSVWSISSIWSVFGVVYLVFCVGVIIKAGGGSGGLTLLNFALIGGVLVGISSPGENPDCLPDENDGLALRVVCKDDDGNLYWADYRRIVVADELWRMWNSHNEFDSDDRYRCDPPHKIYAMHDPAFSGYISHKVYHPAAWWWCPFLVGLIGFVGWLICGVFGLGGQY